MKRGKERKEGQKDAGQVFTTANSHQVINNRVELKNFISQSNVCRATFTIT